MYFNFVFLHLDAFLISYDKNSILMFTIIGCDRKGENIVFKLPVSCEINFYDAIKV